MTEKNQVTITPNAIIGYIDESTPCGRAKVKQVKADLETLATMLQDTNLSTATKQAIAMDYGKAIREYVEREETCCGCTNDCDCEEEDWEDEEEEDWEDEEEEDWEDEEEEDWEEEEEEITICDMDTFTISTDGGVIECNRYEDTIHKVRLLEELGISYDVYAYDNDDNEYPCDVIRNGNVLTLKLAD